jgi:hypothetical protein
MELEAPALVTLTKCENYFHKLLAIKKTTREILKINLAIGSKHNVRQRNCRLSPLHHIWSVVTCVIAGD